MALGIAALISVLAAARAHASGSPAVSLMASTRVAPPVYTASAAAPFHATPLSPVAHHKSGAAVSAGPLGRSVEGLPYQYAAVEGMAAESSARATVTALGLAGLFMAGAGALLRKAVTAPSRGTQYRVSMMSVTGESNPQPEDDDEEEPIWIRRERAAEAAPKDLPFGIYLILSAIIAIAATGSIFEYSYGNPIFGIIDKSSGLWAPILIWFIVTGFPLSAYLFYKAVSVANEQAENMDKLDGY